MAKKKKSSAKRRTSAKKPQAPQHSLPAGFWTQVGAVFLIAFSILFVVAWFGSGGPIVEWMHNTALSTIGYAVYVLPALFVYIAVEIFRAENNQIPFVVKLAAVMTVVWLAGLFGLLQGVAVDPAGGC